MFASTQHPITSRTSRRRSWAKHSKILAAVGAALTLGSAVVACGSGGKDSIDHFGYAISEPMFTTNAATLLGASTQADLLAGRLYPPVFVAGPSGQLIPNRDLASAQSVPGDVRRVNYSISPEAKYSDGAPVTCGDFLLAFRAGTMPELFNSYIPLMEQVENVECTADAKQFTVVFKKDMGSRWRQLFGPGTVLPSHAIAAKVGKSKEELVSALNSPEDEQSMEVLRAAAPVWNDGFNLAAFDPQLQVSSGPFKISTVGEDGHVTLVPNDQYVGDQPVLSEVTIWPKGTDLAAKAADRAVEVADLVGVSEVPWVNRDDSKNPFNISTAVGDLNE